mgnify:CR=1 FL=1
MNSLTRKFLAGLGFVAVTAGVGGLIGNEPINKDVNGVTVVDCYAIGPLGRPDGGPLWRGCNVIPKELSIGAQCIPAPCMAEFYGVSAGARAMLKPAPSGKIPKANEKQAAELANDPSGWSCVIPECSTEDFNK